jgi:hypothetical protein
MIYKIPVRCIDLSRDRWEQKGGGRPWQERPGYIGLFDRNSGEFLWFKIKSKMVTEFAYLAERDEPPTLYWEKLILPMEQAA